MPMVQVLNDIPIRCLGTCIKALELEPTLKCRGKRGGLMDGVCDAYLIALYGKENYAKFSEIQ